MADTKITALTALTAADPANDVIPIVDVSDTTMAASGTTKRISVNNILSSSPTASGALTVTGLVTAGSATITGDLTVDTSTLKVDSTNNRVGIGTATPNYILDVLGASPRFHIKDNGTGSSLLDIENGAGTLYVGRENSTGSGGLSGVPYAGIMYLQGAYPLIFGTNFVERYRIDATGVATWSVAGTTAMTLNSTGLGIGTATINERLAVQTALTGTTAGSNVVARFQSSANGYDSHIALSDNFNPSGRIGYLSGALYLWTNGAERVRIDTSGNVGVGVTPSALWNAAFKAIQIGSANYFSIASQTTATSRGSLLWNAIGSGDEAFVYRSTGDAANRFMVGSGFFAWYTAPSGTAGNPITFTQAMTLDASGSLLIGTTSATVGATAARLHLSADGTDRWAVGPQSNSQHFIIQASNIYGVYLASLTATSWSSASDERLKDVIEPISNAVAKVGSLRAVIGKFKSDKTNTRKPFLMAQDVLAVLPEAVDVSKPDQFGLAYTDVIPLLVAAIKELSAEVNALKNA